MGLILAAFAIYAAYAAELENVLKRPLLALGRRGKGELAVKGTYANRSPASSTSRASDNSSSRPGGSADDSANAWG